MHFHFSSHSVKKTFDDGLAWHISVNTWCSAKATLISHLSRFSVIYTGSTAQALLPVLKYICIFGWRGIHNYISLTLTIADTTITGLVSEKQVLITTQFIQAKDWQGLPILLKTRLKLHYSLMLQVFFKFFNWRKKCRLWNVMKLFGRPISISNNVTKYIGKYLQTCSDAIVEKRWQPVRFHVFNGIPGYIKGGFVILQRIRQIPGRCR